MVKVQILSLHNERPPVEIALSRVPTVDETINLSEPGAASPRLVLVMAVEHTPLGPCAATVTVGTVTIVQLGEAP